MPIVGQKRAETYTPNAGMKTAAQRALDWKDEGKKGMTEVGLKRAKDIVADKAFSLSEVKDANSYFSRHEVDKEATGFKQSEEGYPTPGRVSWDGWGGDPGQKWSKDIVDKNREQPKRLPDAEPPTRGLRAEFDMRDVEVREIGDEETDGSCEFEGYAIRWDEETEIFSWFFSFTERFRRGAFKKTIAERGPGGNGQIKFLRQHNSRQSVAAKMLEMREDSVGLWFRARTIGTQVGKDLAIELREGVVDTLSVGFDSILEEFDKENNLVTVIEARLFEVSAVLWPAYPGATVEAVRSEQLLRELAALPAFINALESKAQEGLSEESVRALRDARDRIDALIDGTPEGTRQDEPCADDEPEDEGSHEEGSPEDDTDGDEPDESSGDETSDEHPESDERDATLELELALRERSLTY